MICHEISSSGVTPAKWYKSQIVEKRVRKKPPRILSAAYIL
jgi:hypothetical protein